MATGSVPISAGTGTPIRVNSNSGVDNGAYQQLFGLAGPDGTLAPHDPDGTLQVSPESTSLFLDDFSGTLATNWTTGGTAPTTAAGVASTSTATTASLASYMRTVGTFMLRQGTYLRASFLVQIEASAVTNNTRWWGIGTNQASPTAGSPVLNGAVFMLDFSDGSMKAATYSNGTRNNVITITRPSDNAYHRYEIYYRQSVIYWVRDGSTVATVTMPNLAVANNLPEIIGSANFTTAPSSGPVLNVTSAAVGDQSGTNRSISDGANPWIQATVKQLPTAASQQSTVLDSALTVQALPPVSLSAAQTAATNAAITLTLGSPGAGLRHHITGIWLQRLGLAAFTGVAQSTFLTITNGGGFSVALPSDSLALGQVQQVIAGGLPSPIRTGSQNTATVFNVPAGGTGVGWQIAVTYFIAP